MAVVLDQASRIAATGWLRDREFDLLMLVGLTCLALGVGGVVACYPAALGVILLADNWLLGFPHVSATFTRLVPDRASVRAHRFLVFGLPPLVIACTAALGLGLGVWAIATVYFYWQWFHTVRQSWGVSQLYRRKAGGTVRDSEFETELLFYLVPVWGLLHRLTTAPDHFLYPSLPIAVPHVPAMLADAVGVLACAGLGLWAVRRVREAIAGELPVLHTAFSFSHFVVFIVGYIVMDDLAGGWVVTNVWHTAQYLMLVWMFNDKVASGGPKGLFVHVTRGNNAWLYFGLCFLLAFPVYLGISRMVALGSTGIIVAVVLNQSLNFHHFIVDSVIWRSKRKPAGTPA